MSGLAPGHLQGGLAWTCHVPGGYPAWKSDVSGALSRGPARSSRVVSTPDRKVSGELMGGLIGELPGTKRLTSFFFLLSCLGGGVDRSKAGLAPEVDILCRGGYKGGYK